MSRIRRAFAATRRRAAWAGLALSLASPLAAAAEHPAGHLFYTSPADDTLVELDETGAVVATHAAGLTLDEPVDAAFAPDGMLYVASRANHRVVRVGPGGSPQGFISGSGLTRPNALAIGPRGNLLVASEDQDLVYEFGLGGGLVRTFGAGSGLDQPSGIAVGTDGRIHVASHGTDEVLVFDGAGTVLGSLGGGSLDGPCRLDFDPAGRLAVVSQADGHVVVLEPDGSVADTVGTSLAGAVEVTLGADGRFYVSEGGAHRIARFEADGTPAAALTGLPGTPSGFAIAPRRYLVKVSGTLHRLGIGAVKVKENATLTVRPGSGMVFLRFQDVPGAEDDLAGTFGATAASFVGFETAPTAGSRSLHGLEVGALPQRDGINSIALTLSGKTAADGSFVPKKVAGTLHRTREGRTFTGSLSGSKLLE